MKRLILGSLCLATLATACAPQVADNEYLMTGTVTEVPDSAIVSLYTQNGNLLKETARDTIIGGRFELRDTLSTLQPLSLMVAGEGFPNTWLNVWVAPGQHIKVSGNGRLFPLWNVKSDIAEQQEENRFVDYTREQKRQILAYNAQETIFFTQMFSKEHREDESFQKAMWNKVDSVRKLSAPFEFESARREVELMKTTPVSLPWLDRLESNALMVKIATNDTTRQAYTALSAPLKELYAALPDSVKQTPTAQRAYHSLFPPKRVKVGDEMVDGVLYDPDGKEHRLAEFKGKYILLDFWSRGCGPCIASIPELEEVAQMHADRLAVVSISIDTETMWKQYLKEKGLKGNQWNELRNDGGGLKAVYGVQGIPHYVLIAPDGKVKDTWAGYGKGVIKDNLKANVK